MIETVMGAQIHAIILTFNEERHIARCIESVRPWVHSILVIDSHSTDATVAIARKLGAETVTRDFVNHSDQVNAAIDMLADKSGWILRIDADEVIEPGSGLKLQAAVNKASEEIAGLTLRRHISFLGRRIRWGGIEPNPQLRVWRNGRGRSEQRWMDEHVVVKGLVASTNVDLTDNNLNSVGWWTTKHNDYASREAIELLRSRMTIVQEGRLASIPAAKRWIKLHIYNRLPAALRSSCYFFLRYFILLGFLDGPAGFYFHFLQGFWYRTLVDAKVADVQQAMSRDAMTLTEAAADRLGIILPASDHP